MRPRLVTSTKWTAFPKAYIDQIQEVFQEAFAEQLQTGKFVVEGRLYPEEICLRVGYLAQGRLQQNNFEVSIDYSGLTGDAQARIHSCIDAAASLMNEFFLAEGDVELPLNWKNFDFNSVELWVQYNTINSALEAEADALLGKSPLGLVQEDDEDIEFASKGDTASAKKTGKKRQNLH